MGNYNKWNRDEVDNNIETQINESYASSAPVYVSF